MEIKTSTVYTYEAFKDFYRFSVFQGKYGKIGKYVLLIFCPVALIFLSMQLKDFIILFLFISFIFIYAFIFYFIMPKKAYKTQLNVFNGSNVIIFKSDEIKVTITNCGFSANSSIQYFALYKIYETEKYFYLYLNKRAAYVIAKTGINNGTIEELRAFLKKKLGQKGYVKCI